jgi:flagellar motility protein MotE (MotC chaperone)
MREPLRLLSVLAVLMGGLFGIKALAVANGASDLWEAHAATLAAVVETGAQEPSQDAGAGEGDAQSGEAAAAPAAPIMPARETASAAFAERIANGVRTAEEERVIYRLRERSAELDRREQALDTREALMLAMEQRVDGKIAELQNLRQQVEALTDTLSERESEDMQVIVAWYAAMDARDAAERIASLDMDTQIQIAARMSQRVFGPILAEMTPDAAALLTQRMAGRSVLPETVAELEARIAEGG